MAKLFVNERDSIELPEKSQNLLYEEVATRERIGEFYTQFFSVVENPDPVLRRTGQSIAVYDEIKRDTQVSSCITGRTSGIQALRWKLEQNKASDLSIEVITNLLSTFKMHTLWKDMLDAVNYGYNVSELVWSPNGGYILPIKIESKPHEWFWFDPSNRLMRKNSPIDIIGVPAEPRKFLLMRHNHSYKNPYGEGLLSMCFWPVTFKKGGIKFWAVFLEKFGMPHAVGKLPIGASHTERAILLQALTRMVRDACAVFPDNSSIELIESVAKGASSDLYERHAKYHDGEISKVILGHASAADSTPGRLGGEDNSMSVREDLVNADSLLICEGFNELIKWIHELNPSLGTELPSFVLYEKENVDKTLAERDDIVARNGKVKFKKEYYKRAYGYSDNDIIVDESPIIPGSTQTQAQFSEPAPDNVASAEAAVNALVNAYGDDTMQKQMEAVLKPVFDLRDKSASFEEFRAGLVELYPNMDTSGIEKILEGSGLLASVWGRINSDKA
jgi:phage gp29-like protein